jgi:2-keto-4-pentenoate hydratase
MVPTMTTIVALAQALRDAQARRVPIAPLRDAIGATNVDSAYAIQENNTCAALEAGRRLIGRKIGLTAKAVQLQLGVDQPDYGMLFADMLVESGVPIAPERVIQPRVEAEVALVLERDLPAADTGVADVIRATAFCLPALEIVDSRIQAWDIKLADTIADNASSGLFVLGDSPVGLSGLDLRLAGMVMERGTETVSLGVGAACLGNPLNAAAWLARTMARVGRPLKAGDILMTGALGPMVAASAGDVFNAQIGGLGSVRAVFAR